jgi:flavin-dependent dehydrogenase
MTTAINLKRFKGDVPQMEREVLFKNPNLKKIFQSCTVLTPFPVSISQINFDKKSPVEKGVLMIGDAAGTIPPLCGNGMSMALHSSKLAAPLVAAYLDGTLSREQMEKEYTRAWNGEFSRRLYAGRLIQRFFGRSWLTNGFVALFRIFPRLSSFAIRQTHGKPF